MNNGIQNIFSEIPRSYELINHILTFGADIICRKRVAKMAVAYGGRKWLDICTGTGEMAANLVRLKQNGTSVIAADFSRPMICKAIQKPEAKGITFILSEAGALPFDDNTLDLITISFATRNIASGRNGLTNCFREFHRVLKSGGHFVNLETSQPESKLIRRLMHLYVSLTVKQIGSRISGSEAGYAYLSHSIPRFHNAEELANILRQCGFRVSFKRMFFGIIAAHTAVK